MKGRIWIILAALLLCNAIGIAVLMANSEANAAGLAAPTAKTHAPVHQAVATTLTPAMFSTITVNTTLDEDSGSGAAGTRCSLREAIKAANDPANAPYNGCAAGSSGTDIIAFDATAFPASVPVKIIDLVTELPPITSNLSIQGIGRAFLIVQRANGAPDFRVFTITSAATNATISGLTICNGKGLSLNGTGLQNAGKLTLDGVLITANNTDAYFEDPVGSGNFFNHATNNGGGIENLVTGDLTLKNCDISGNYAGTGGGIYNAGKLTMTLVTINNNDATPNAGGGLYNLGVVNAGNLVGGIVTMTRGVFKGNRADAGGGIYNSGGGLITLTNVSLGLNETFGTNENINFGGKAIYNEGNTPTLNSIINLRSVTVGQHVAPSEGDAELDNAIYVDANATIKYRDTIFANAAVGFANFTNHGTLVSEGHNICDDATGVVGQPGDKPLGTDAKLDNGGIQTYGTPAENAALIETFRLQCDSPAINAGSAAAPPKDARDVDRLGAADIGSYEFNFQAGFINPADSKFNAATNLPNFTTGQPYSVTLAAIGGLTPYSFQLASGSVLPSGFTFNSSTGVLSNPNPTVGGTFTIVVNSADPASSFCPPSKTFTLSSSAPTNTPPTITPVTLSRMQGSPAGAAVTIATVNDAQTAPGSLIVTQIAGGTATGITLTGITNTNGTITAQVAASCAATSGTVCLQVSDGSLTAKGNLTINVSANTDPVLTYSTPAPVCFGAAATINPATGPSDNGSVSSIILQSVAPSVPNGSITVNNSTGVVTVSHTTPTGLYTVTVRATDNCGKATDASFALNVVGSLIISEFRLSGPNGQNDWYVELFNSTNAAINTTGLKLGVVNQDGSQVVSYDLPANISIPSRRYYLIAGSTYSLTSSASANLTAPALGAGFNLAGAGLFKGAVTDSTKRMDSVGMSSINVGATYRFYVENTPVPSLANTTAQHAFVRKFVSGLPTDTNHNLADFILVSPTPTTAINGITPQPGAPGPQNAASPLANNTGVPFTLFNTAVGTNVSPNQFVENVAVTVDGTTYSRSLYLRRKVTNNTGGAITKLRFRIIEMSNGGVNTAILRSLNSIDATVDGLPVKGLTLEAPTIGTGGVNSTLCAGTIALPVQLANNASVNVQFRLGVLQGGSYRFFVNVEPQ